MNPNDRPDRETPAAEPASEEQFTSLMAACDDALAVGRTPEGVELEDSSGHLQPRLNRNLACARLMRQVLGRRADPAPPNGLPWTALGRFRLLRELGRGGMGIVYLAHDPHLGRQVALKVPRAEMAVTPELRERFHREARAAASLDHPNVVPIYEAGEIGAVCFLVSAYCSGVTLAQWLKQRTEPIPFRQAAALLAALADAMQHAHTCGVVHRDLKPSNVLLETRGPEMTAEMERKGDELPFVPRVTDFGLARFHLETKEQTQTGLVLGTASYMAPEQATGKARTVGPAADIYALGVILYELLTGRLPFQGANDLETLVQIQADDPVSPGRLRLRTPPDLETICMKCLRREPARRYATALALAHDLHSFQRGEPIQARPMSTAERLGRWCGRNPALAATSALAVVALASVVGLAVFVAVQQHHAAERLRQEQEQTKEALREAKKQSNRAEQRLAHMAVDRGLTLCEQGKVEHGLLWLARGLEIASALEGIEADDLCHVARANLAHWRREIRPLCGLVAQHELGVRGLTFHADGKGLLVADYGGNIGSWDVNSGQPLRATFPVRNDVNWVALHRDGKTLAIGIGSEAQLRNADTGQPLGKPVPHSAGVQAGAISPDGRLLLTGIGIDPLPPGATNLGARFWEVGTGKSVGPRLQQDDGVWAVAWSPDGQTVVTGSHRGSVYCWDVATGRRLDPEIRHQGKVRAVAFSPDGRLLLTASSDGTANLWEVTTGKSILGKPLQHPNQLTSATFSPDGRTVYTGCADRMVRLWAAAEGKPLGRPIPFPTGIGPLSCSPDGRFLAVGGYQEPVRIWDVSPSGSALPDLPHPDGVRGVAFSPDGQTVLTGCYDKAARLWNVASGKLLGQPLPHRGRVLTVAFHPDGRRILTGDDVHSAQIWSSTTFQPEGPAWHHPDAVGAVAWSADGKLALTGCGDGHARIWEASTGKAIRTLVGNRVGKVSVNGVAFSPDGQQVLTGDGLGRAWLWDASTGTPLEPPLQHRARLNAVAWSPQGRTLLTAGSDMVARLWDATTRTPLGQTLTHEASVMAIAYSPDGRTLATGSYDRTVRLWDTATGKLLGPPLLHEDGVMALAISPDGRALVSGGRDRTARLWAIPAPVADEPERVRLWVEVITGLELNADGVIGTIDADAWKVRRNRIGNEVR